MYKLAYKNMYKSIRMQVLDEKISEISNHVVLTEY